MPAMAATVRANWTALARPVMPHNEIAGTRPFCFSSTVKSIELVIKPYADNVVANTARARPN